MGWHSCLLIVVALLLRQAGSHGRGEERMRCKQCLARSLLRHCTTQLVIAWGKGGKKTGCVLLLYASRSLYRPNIQHTCDRSL